MRGSNGVLVGGVIALAVILALVTWMLGIGPRFARAADAEEARIAQEDSNFQLELSLAKRIADAEQIPQYREEIYEIRDDLPAEREIPELRRLLFELFEENDLVIFAEEIGSIQTVTPRISLAIPAAEVGLVSQVDGLAFTGVIATQVNLTTAGTREQILGLMNSLQLGDHQYFLVTAFAVTAVTESVEDLGVSLDAGDLRLVVSGFFFTLDYGNPEIQVRPEPEPTVSPSPEPSPDPSASPEPEPEPNDRNFFIPIGNS